MTGHRAMTAADRVVLVCGATSGIGEATARRLAASGVRLTLVGRRQAAGADLAAQLRAGGTDASFIVADMTVDAEAKAAVDHTLDRYGRLDGAFNNVGDVVSAGPVQTLTLTGWNAELAANLTSVFLGLKYQIPAILGTSGRGSIVNNAAVAGIVGVAGLSAYTAAKHGVIGLTRAAALEVAHKNVRINALVTGTVLRDALRMLTRSVPSCNSCSATPPDSSPARPYRSTAVLPPGEPPPGNVQEAHLILITGGLSSLGVHTAQELLNRGESVIVITQRRTCMIQQPINAFLVTCTTMHFLVH